VLGRLFFLLLLVLGVGLYLPDSRALLSEWARPAIEPGYRWMTQQEMDRIAADFGVYMTGRGTEPLRRTEFDSWLDERYPRPRSRVDSWGTPYTAEVTRTGFTIRSAGPDLAPRTADDLLAEGVRN
jgi:hypothetical protein